MRVAIVHDRLVQLGGAERVVQALQRIWPDADLFTSVVDRAAGASAGFDPVRTTYLQHLPGATSLARATLPLHPHAFGRLRLDGYDVVISSSAFFAKCVRPPTGAVHVCYCHTPARFLWGRHDDHARDQSGALARAATRLVTPALRRADLRGARGVHEFIANSSFIAGSIERCYGRSAEVIPPPVEVERYAPGARRSDYLIAVARLDPYKRIDHAIEACAQLGLPLKVIGQGVDTERLRALAGRGVELLGWVDEEEKASLLAGALALVAPQVEDFGIAMVEAIAAGTPVVAPAAGGALEIVEHGRTGVLYPPGAPGGLATAIEQVLTLDVDPAALHDASLRFSEAAFAGAMEAFVDRAVARHHGSRAGRS